MKLMRKIFEKVAHKMGYGDLVSYPFIPTREFITSELKFEELFFSVEFDRRYPDGYRKEVLARGLADGISEHMKIVSDENKCRTYRDYEPIKYTASIYVGKWKGE
jgi:hypothetical protein